MRMTNKKTIIMAINIVFLIAQVVISLHILSGDILCEKWSQPATIMSLVYAGIIILSFAVLKIKIYDFQFVFIILLYLFMYGRIWLNYLNMDDDLYWSLHVIFSKNVLLKASLYVSCAVTAVFTGLITKYGVSKKDYRIDEQSINNNSKTSFLYSASLLLLLVGVPCRLFMDLKSVVEAQNAGGTYLGLSDYTGIIDDLAVLFIPGLLCLMERKNRRERFAIAVIVIAYSVLVMILTGDRRYYVSGILAIGFYVAYKEREGFKRHKVLALFTVLLSLIFLNLLQIIREIRAGNLVSVTEFIGTYGYRMFDFSTLVFDVLGEFGISFYSVCNIVENIPKALPYQYGLTFARTIPSFLPVGFLFGDFFLYANPSSIINVSNGRYLGSTLIGDMYANFGFVFGIVFCFAFSALLSFIFKKCKRCNGGLHLIMYYSLFYFLINLTRCSVFESYRETIWTCLILYLIYYRYSKKTRVYYLRKCI